MGEELLRYYSSKGHFSAIILRPPNIYGPGSDHGVVYHFINGAKKGNIVIHGDGEQKRDFLFVSDYIEAILKSIPLKTDFEVFNVGSGEICSLNELARLVKAQVNKKAEIIYEKERDQDYKLVASNTKKIEEKLGWSSKLSLKKGILETI